MGDIVEDIIAEPEEPSFFSQLLSSLQNIPEILVANGWYILIGGGLAYYVWNKYSMTLAGSSSKKLSPKEIESFERKEEARRRYVEQLQERYNQESTEKAELDRIKEEEKRKARIAEMEQLVKSGSGQKLGSSSSQTGEVQSRSVKKSSTPSLRPEYNPLMGDSSSGRSCFRRPGGSAGG